MSLQYSTPGAQALERLRAQCGRAHALQRDLLRALIRHNEDTELGRRLGFGRVHSVEDYQALIPVSSYDDYADAIGRMLDGAQNVLSADEAIYFSLTSGTTGEQKYLPVSLADMEIHYYYAYEAIFGMVREHFPQLPEEKLFGKIFQVGEFVETTLPDGRMNGIRSSALYQWLNRDGSFDTSDYCAPKEVVFPGTLEDLTYVKARFALAERQVRCLHGVFIHRMTGMLRYIETNWDMLVEDMERGTVNPQVELSPRWRQLVEERLGPDPERASELRAITPGPGMALAVWPELTYVMVIGGSAFAPYMEHLTYYTGDVPIHYFAYAASEGVFAVAPGLDRPDEYLLIPEAGFFEFLPVDAPEGSRPLTMWELRPGMRCELIFTNHSGLYRYAMGDILEVTGFYGQSPIVKFCYRKNLAINVASEMMTTEDLEHAIQDFQETSGLDLGGNYCVCDDYSAWTPCYKLYLEAAPADPAQGEAQLDDCLSRACWGYHSCRTLGEIGPPRIVVLPRGSFGAYERFLGASGLPTAQGKPLRILKSAKARRWFEELEEGNEG